MEEVVGDLLPLGSRNGGIVEVQGLCDALGGGAHGPGERLDVEWRLGSLGTAERRRPLAQAVLVDDERGEHRADERGVDQGPDGRGGARSDLVELATGLVELVVELDLPADAVDVGDRGGPDGARQAGQVEAVVALGGTAASASATNAKIGCFTWVSSLPVLHSGARLDHLAPVAIGEQCQQNGVAQEPY